jgi:hypothetical protein
LARLRTPLVVLLVGVVLGLAGFAWGMQRDQVSKATATILLNPVEGNPFAPNGTAGGDLVDLETEAQLAASHDVARLVAEQRGTDADEELSGIDVSVPVNTQLLEITATDDSAQEAADRAQLFAETYLDYRQARAEGTVFDRSAGLREQVVEQTRELRRLVAELDAARPGSTDALLVRQQVVEATTQLGQLRLEAAGLEATPVDPGQVVSNADGGGDGPLPTSYLAGLLGLLLGLFGGTAWAVSRHRVAGWVRDPDDLGDAGAPVLATVTAGAPTDDELARLRAGVVSRRGGDTCVALLVGVPTAPTLTRPLGESLARSNLETMLVDAAGTGPQRGRGLTDLLRGRADIDEVLRTDGSHLATLRAGTNPDDLEDLVLAPAMREVVGDLGKRVDLLLLTAGDAASPRVEALARQADLVVLEVLAGRTTAREVQEAVRELTDDGRVPAGLVLVVPPGRRR